MRTALWHQAAIVTVCGLVLFTNLGGPTLWDIDEPRNAVCAREMLERGDWVVPTFNGELRAHKPVLLYWFMMTAYQALGVNEFSARLWSVLLGIGTVLVTYHLGRRMFNPRVGLLGALVLASSLNFGVVARAATPDSVFLFFVTAALALFVFGSTAPQTWRVPSLAGWLAVYAAMGLAVLAKGPVGAVLPLAVIGLWRMIDGRAAAAGVQRNEPSAGRWAQVGSWLRVVLAPRNVWAAGWSMRPFTALAVISAVALPWYVVVTQRTGGAWLEEFLLKHNVSRFLEPMEHHSGPIFYYLIVLCIGFFPWSLFIAPTLCEMARPAGVAHDRRPYAFLACWAGVYVAFFSLASTKLPNYVMPAYPALALATAGWLDALLTRRSTTDVRWMRRACGSLAAVGIALAVGLVWAAGRYLPGEQAIGLVGLVPVFAGVAAFLLAGRARLERSLATFGAGAVLLATLLLGGLVLRIDRHQHTADLIAHIRDSSDGQPTIASYRYFRPSWVFYYGQPIAEYDTAEQVGEFFRRSPAGFLITNDKGAQRLAGALPKGVTPLVRAPQFLKPGEIVVLGRGAKVAGTRRVPLPK